MEALLEQFVENVLNSALGEGERALKLKALSICISTVQGFRKLLILHYMFMIACFLWAMSFFASVFLYVTNPQLQQPLLLASLGVLGVSTLVMYFTVREKAWIQAFGLDVLMRQAERERTSFFRKQSSGVDPETLARMIDKIMDEKLEKLAREKMQQPEPPTDDKKAAS